MTKTRFLVPLLAGLVLLADATGHVARAGDGLDFDWLRDTITEESKSGRSGKRGVDTTDILGSWVRWSGRVDRVLEPQEGLWLVLVEMDGADESSASHDLEVWTDDGDVAGLAVGQEITIKGTIVDYRLLPGSIVRIVVDART